MTVAWSQFVLRAVVFLGPVVAVLATGPAGNWPPWWAVGTVLVLSAGGARSPDSSFVSAAVLVGVMWWILALSDGLHPAVLVAAGALVVTHVAALVASYGPGTMPIDPALVRLWLRRGALVLLTVPAAWGVARLLRGDPEQPGIWVLGVVATLAATVVATTVLTGRPGE